METIERRATGLCLAAQADDITAAIMAATEPGADVRIIVSGDDWRVCVSTLTASSCAVMPYGADGEARSGRKTRERGYITSRFDLEHAPRESDNAAMKVIGRSRLIHRAEVAA